MKFVPAPGCVEVEPLKQEGIIINPEQKFEEMGKIVSIAVNADRSTFYDLKIGDVIAFDSYACRATTDMEGNKHYVVQINDGGYLGKYVEGE